MTDLANKREPKIHLAKNEKALCRQNSATDSRNTILTSERSAVTCQMCSDMSDGKINFARFNSVAELPEKAFCKLCELEKPITEMMVAYLRKEKVFRVRPRCKECHNESEKGKRRDYKTKYLQKWRKKNPQLNKSYWDNPESKEKARINAYNRFTEKHEAILIQGRMNRRGMNSIIEQAEEFLKLYGRCYPSRLGLSKAGLRRFEQIRSRLRQRKAKKFDSFEIRLMIYEESEEEKSLIIPPIQQQVPFKVASERFKQWHRNQRVLSDDWK